MKTIGIIFPFSLLFSPMAEAVTSPATVAVQDEVKLSFDRVPVVELINAVYGDILKENFVLHPALVNSEQTVTLQFQDNMDKAHVRKFMVSFLNSVGIDAEQKSGYVFLRPLEDKKKEESDDEMFFYRPKYRTVSYITDLSGSVFTHGRFTSQRIVKSFGSQKPGVNATPDLSQPRAVDNGTNAFSQQDKAEVDAFIFSGTAKEIVLLQKLLEQIDLPVGEVMVKGVVYEVTTTSAEGSAFSLAAAILGQRFGVNIGKTVAGDSFSITTPNFNAVVGALNSDNHFKSINNASLRVKSGATGHLSVGSDVPVLGSVTVASGGISQQSVTYQPSGVIFNLSPTIRDGSIDMVIDEQISSFVATTTGVNNSPTLIKRQMSTTVGAGNDDVIVLGGLDQDNGNKGSTGAGFLPAFFRSMASDSTKTEVLLILNVHKI
jgi:general secretion pathway protein D